MARIVSYVLKMSKRERIGSGLGIISSISGVILWVILNFLNPYSSEGSIEATIRITFMWLGLPAICGLVASVFRIKWLMYTTFIVSLPFSSYMAATPSIFKLFILVSLCYLVSAVLMIRRVTKVKENKDTPTIC